MNIPEWGWLLFLVVNSWGLLLLAAIHFRALRTEDQLRLLRSEVRSNYHRGRQI